MAATALNAAISRVRDNAVSADSYLVSSGDGTATFVLKGGIYMVEVMASTYGTVALQKRGPDGSTYVAVKNAAGTAVSFTADGTLIAQLAAGIYKFALS